MEATLNDGGFQYKWKIDNTSKVVLFGLAPLYLQGRKPALKDDTFSFL